MFAERRATLDRLRSPSRLSLRLKLGLLAGMTAALVVVLTALLTVQVFRRQLLKVLTDTSSSQSDALRAVLDDQMKTGDRTTLRDVVTEIGASPGVSWVALVDAAGRVRISSNPAEQDRLISRESPECAICHAKAPSDRLRSVTLMRPEGNVLRTVTPLANGAQCQRCHVPDQRVIGMLVVDRSLEPVETAVLSGRTQLVLGALTALITLLGLVGLAIESLVLLRLRRLSAAALALGQGDLTARAFEGPRDELGQVATDFNSMADRLATAMGHLAAERRQLHELVDGIADGVVLVDTQLRVLIANQAFAGRLPKELQISVSSSYADLARSAGFERAPAPTPARRALESGHLEKEILHFTNRAGEHFEEVYAQPLRGADGTVVGAIEVWRDITDRKALEMGLEQSERLAGLGIIASSVAHEVGNPLASIATAVEGLLRRLDEPGGADAAELREYLEIVRNQVFRCHGVTQRLLGFARVPTARPVTVDAAQAAREALALVGPQARKQKVEIRARLEKPAPAMAEEMLLEQVFLNLILNALKAMPDGGLLEVDAHEEAGALLVTLRDTGPGIPETIRPYLFQPFRRGSDSGVGTGLGLFLSQTLVHRCGGTISVESSSGRGTAFTVRLKPGMVPPVAPSVGIVA